MTRRLGGAVIVVLTVGTFLAGGMVRVQAQVPPKPEPLGQAPQAQVSTTTTSVPISTTTLPPTSTPPPTAAPATPPMSAPISPAPAPTPPAASPLEPAPDTGPVAAPVPPPNRPHSNYIPTGSNSSAALLEALRALESLGFTPEEAMRTGMGHFPLAAYATYSDDWHAPRGTPEAPRLHMGTDIFAAYGAPVRAPFDGVVSFRDSGLGGKAATLTTGDGTFFYMAHLSAFAPDGGGSVKQGDIVGLNGDSGNAVGGSPHVHFEVHPGGGAAVNPKPLLDSWLAEALVAAEALYGSFRSQTVESGGQSSMVHAMGQVRRFDSRQFAGQSRPQMAQLLWASSVSPTGGALRLAEHEAARAAQAFDWELMATEARARATLRRNVLMPLTPPGFGDIVTRRRG